MRTTAGFARLSVALAVLVVAACQDLDQPLDPAPEVGASVQGPRASARAQEALREVMALQQTVFAGRGADGRLVIGVENRQVAPGVRRVLARFGIAEDAYVVRVTPPIHFANLRTTEFRPALGGVQIHWSNFLCTLGFSVDHEGGRSFITNSHCTDQQGAQGSTVYHQPLRTGGAEPIGVEADDPPFVKGGQCSGGKMCRFSDAARVLYAEGIASNPQIAKTSGPNTGSLDVTGAFTITNQNNSSTSFSGTIHKVGRTTGWTSGTVTVTCATVNVSGSRFQLLCQTIVENPGETIVAGGDSGSPVFRRLSGDNVELVGILWGGNADGSLFVFSPLKSIRDELGAMVATTSGTGGPGDGDGGDDGDEPCRPRGNSGQCK